MGYQFSQKDQAEDNLWDALKTLVLMNDAGLANGEDKDDVIIDDIGNLCFKKEELSDDYKIGNTNVSQLFRQYQNELVKISNDGSLTVESNVQEILSLSLIFY
ncbi:6397_t:CDS:2 [Entrophospora sp. SA101]|nr:6397_t:CDS:2 [Entrophospora sp. SA101]